MRGCATRTSPCSKNMNNSPGFRQRTPGFPTCSRTRAKPSRRPGTNCPNCSACAARWQGKTEEEIAANGKAEFEKIKGFRILKKEALSDDEVVLTLYVEGLSPDEPTPRMKLVRIGSEWKTAGPYKDRPK